MKFNDQMYETILNNMHESVYVRDLEMNLIYLNPASEKLTGYTLAEAQGMKCYQMFGNGHNTCRDTCPVEKAICAKEALTDDNYKLKTRSGTVKEMRVSISPLFEAQEVTGAVMVIEAITGIAQIEDQLQAAMFQLETLIQNLQLGVLFENAQREVMLVNQMFCTLFGLPSPEVMVGVNCADTAAEFKKMFTNADYFIPRIDEVIARRRPVTGDELHTIDGYALVRDYAPVYAGETFLGHLWQYRDITHLVKIEKALRKSETSYRSIFTLSPDFIYLTDEQGNILDANPALLNQLQISLEQIQQHNVRHFFSGDDPTKLNNALKQLQAGQKMRNFEISAAPPGSSPLFYEINAVPIQQSEKNDVTVILSMARDITKHKQAESLLHVQRDLALALSSARNLAETFDQLLDAVFQIEGLDCGGVYLVDELTGDISLVAHKGIPPDFVQVSFYYSADAPQSRLVMAGDPIYGHHSNIAPVMDDVRRQEQLRALAIIPVQHEGQVIAAFNLASHTHDDLPVTTRQTIEIIAAQVGSVISRVKAEEALRENRKNLQSLFDTLDEFLFILDADGYILQTNPVVRQRLGYSANELVGMHVLEVHPPHRREEAAAIVEAMIAGQETACPVPVITKDGHLIPVETKVTPGTWSNRDVLFGISRDVSERVRADEALRKSEERFRTLANFTYDWEYWVGLDQSFIYISPSCQRISGYSADEFYANPQLLETIIHPHDQTLMTRHLHDEFNIRDPFSTEFRIITKCGQKRWIGHTCQPVYGADGQWMGRRGSNRDITNRVEMEQTLRSTLIRTEALYHLSRSLISQRSLSDLLKIMANNVAEGVGVNRVVVVTFNLKKKLVTCFLTSGTGTPHDIVSFDELMEGLTGWVARNLKPVLSPGHKLDSLESAGVQQRRAKNGYGDVIVVPLLFRGKIQGTITAINQPEQRKLTSQDVELMMAMGSQAAVAIENARLYEQAQQDAETKTILLQEVNHRVKNNLLAIAGMLHIERRYAKKSVEPRNYQDVLSDLINRIEGLLQVHNMLSASWWTPLPLSNLVKQSIHSALQALPPDKQVSLNVQANDPIQVNPKQSGKLAMVINELTTNVIKYGLPQPGQSAQITVCFALKDETILLEFKDNGPGFPNDVLQLKHHNVGMYLIQNIVCEDLRGKLTLHNDNGAVITISLPQEL